MKKKSTARKIAKKSRVKRSVARRASAKRAFEVPAARPSRAIVGVVAPSSPAPRVELMLGARRLIDAGFEVFLHPQVNEVSTFFAGTDAERAHAFLDYAYDPDLNVIWAARGGYGAARILPILDEVYAGAGRPEPKTLVGFSDATVLLEYVRTRWGWRALHGPMPATFHIERVQGKDWKNFADAVAGDATDYAFRLRPIHRPKAFARLVAPLVGGNLAMIHSVLGTPYAFDLEGKILFLEEIGEAPYRIDRMMRQLLMAGALGGVRAIVLGSFTDCRDSAPRVYAAPPRGKGKPSLKPLRKTLSEKETLRAIFGEIGATLGIPVFAGLPVGHGDAPGTIELGREYSLEADGALRSR